jgi:hypothetical protein
MADVSTITSHVSPVTIYVTVFPAQLGPLAIGGGIIVMAQVAAEFLTIMFDLGFVSSNITLIVADIPRVTSNITVTPMAVLGHHRPGAHDANEQNAKITLHVLSSCAWLT